MSDGNGNAGDAAETWDRVDPWADSLDDLSHVYVPQGGLAGVEVADGEARLLHGKDMGWIATSIITCPAGHRYDLVILEAETPGNSSVQISVLNASEEASQVGYANETVEGYVKFPGTELLIYDLNSRAYPIIRIQVNLVADGANRPRLLDWAVHFVPLGEWRDDFVSSLKISMANGVELKDGKAMIDLTNPPSVSTDYKAYPTMAFSHYGTTDVSVLKANEDRTGYGDKSVVNANFTYDVAIDDLNADGYLDLVCGNRDEDYVWYDSQIYWGSSSGEWSRASSTNIKTKTTIKVDTGDINGDGWPDIVFACYRNYDPEDSFIFLNQGGGSFNYAPDITFADTNFHKLAIGDLNGDGYNDVVFAQDLGAVVYFSSSTGPDQTADILFDLGTGISDIVVDDLDGDGYMDLVFGSSSNCLGQIFMGGPNGPDNSPDYLLSDVNGWVYGVAVGDINGDGFADIMFQGYYNDYIMWVYEGSINGWYDHTRHDIDDVYYPRFLECLDIDKDGYDDIITRYDDDLQVFLGGTEWPTHSDFRKGIGGPNNIAIGAKGGDAKACLRGTYVTEVISRPTTKKWDILHLNGDVPKNTSVAVSVLTENNTNIQGYTDLEGLGFDLSGIEQSRIRIRVTMRSELNNTTPTLDSLMVRWMDRNIWREEFYGPAKVQRLWGTQVTEGALRAGNVVDCGPQVLISSLRDDSGYNSYSNVYFDDGDLDYLSREPTVLRARGVAAADAVDTNGDGYVDIALAVHQVSDTTFSASSPLFLGTPVGWRSAPDHKFPTVGARDVLLEDIDGDGHVDAVFAQERDGSPSSVNSTLFWGSPSGWSPTPDVEFTTRGASGVVAADLDGDGDLDLAFACYRAESTATNSMVFLQGADGFNGGEPSHLLATKGARAVAAGDLDADGRTDLVFANSLFGGFAEIDSYVYWGKAGGGYETDPTGLATSGAEDVKVEDLDGDGDLDLVFANAVDNNEDRLIESYVYLNDGTGGLSSGPNARLPTVGAVAVEVADLDGTGWKDLVFACQFNGTGYDVPSVCYLGGSSGWGSTASFELPTYGGSDALAKRFVMAGCFGYISKAITPEDPSDTGAFHTLRYTATLEDSQTVTLRVVDSVTWEVLAEIQVEPGTHEWVLEDAFKVKEHPSISIMVEAKGLDGSDAFALDSLWLNWTKRVRQPPEVLDLSVSQASVLRTKKIDLEVSVQDEYDPVKDLMVTVQHRATSTLTWETYLMGPMACDDEVWRAVLTPKIDAPVGSYDFRVSVKDSDGQVSGVVEFPSALEVLNNPPTAPEVRIDPARPVTTSTLQAVIIRPGTDIESNLLTYTYRWFRDGELVEGLTKESVPYERTSRGQNWSVEVRTFDGDDEGPSAAAWRVVQNAAPVPMDPLPDPEFDEDTVDTNWLDLSGAFEDPDGDPLTWTVNPIPQHIEVEIDEATGRVTLRPEANWNGEEEVTFVASDGELQACQKVKVMVTPVNDIPTIVSVNDQPVGGDHVEFTIQQGELLKIILGVLDVEGDELVFSVNTSLVEIDSKTGEMSFQPDNDAVGTLRFGLKLWDIASPTMKVGLDFTVNVVNENDPMEEPKIVSPSDGSVQKVNKTFSLMGHCYDPDVQYGQVLNFSWSSNLSGHLGWGSSITVALMEPGTHVITLTVTDGEFEKTDFIELTVQAVPEGPSDPTPNDVDDDDGRGSSFYVMLLGIIAGIVVTGISLTMTMTRRRSKELDEEEALDEEESRREALRRMAATAREAADAMERTNGKADIEAEDDEDGYEEIEYESVRLPGQTLSMEAKVTARASDDVEALWADISNGNGVDEDDEQLRIDSLKRQYQNTIGRLPYGIPSHELRDRDWNDLATALATGAKRTLPDGRELTEIDGRWYYSDMEDASTFLKEHGAKPRAETKRAPRTTDKETLLATLEERFILGEISEETFRELKAKYDK
jgi:hypothetical protein